MRILITEVIWKEGIKELKEQGFEVDYDESLWKNRKKILEVIGKYDAIIVRNQTNVDEELLNSAVKLKVIGRLGVGLDNINIPKSREIGAKVVFAKNANATSVAEYVMAVIMEASRPLHLAGSDVRKGNWNRKLHTYGELYNKTIGLIGLGEISHRVSIRAKSFGMKVIGYDPFITEFDHILSESNVIRKSTIEDVLVESDFISLHIPLTSKTRNLISKDEFRLMKPSSFLINSSRGGIVDEIALANALDQYEISGVFLDVLESEPLENNHELLKYKNVVITPHIAGLTEESQIRTSLLVAKETATILKGGNSLCVV